MCNTPEYAKPRYRVSSVRHSQRTVCLMHLLSSACLSLMLPILPKFPAHSNSIGWAIFSNKEIQQQVRGDEGFLCQIHQLNRLLMFLYTQP